MTAFEYEDLVKAEEKGFALGFFCCQSYISIHQEHPEKPIEKRLKRLGILLNTAYSVALELLDRTLQDEIEYQAETWFKQYEKKVEAQAEETQATI